MLFYLFHCFFRQKNLEISIKYYIQSLSNDKESKSRNNGSNYNLSDRLKQSHQKKGKTNSVKYKCSECEYNAVSPSHLFIHIRKHSKVFKI